MGVIIPAQVTQAIPVPPPACQIRKTAPTAVAHATVVALPFDAEDYDSLAMHSLVTNPSRVTITTPGLYVVHALANFDASTLGYRPLQIGKNGSAAYYGAINTDASAQSGIGVNLTTSAVLPLAASDYVETSVFHSVGAPLNVTGRMAVTMVGPYPA